MINIPNKPLLTVKDVLPIFETNKNTFYGWIKAGVFPEKMVETIGKTIKIRKSILEKYLNGDI